MNFFSELDLQMFIVYLVSSSNITLISQFNL